MAGRSVGKRIIELEGPKNRLEKLFQGSLQYMTIIFVFSLSFAYFSKISLRHTIHILQSKILSVKIVAKKYSGIVYQSGFLMSIKTKFFLRFPSTGTLHIKFTANGRLFMVFQTAFFVFLQGNARQF
jgi:hypothetical protein